MLITNIEATFDKGKASVAFDIEEAVIEDLGSILSLISSFSKHPSNNVEVKNEPNS
jgi:hypothetical protein